MEGWHFRSSTGLDPLSACQLITRATPRGDIPKQHDFVDIWNVQSNYRMSKWKQILPTTYSSCKWPKKPITWYHFISPWLMRNDWTDRFGIRSRDRSSWGSKHPAQNALARSAWAHDMDNWDIRSIYIDLYILIVLLSLYMCQPK